MATNFVMFMVTVYRKGRVLPTGNVHRDRIASITINRAMRLELIFFLCQFARFFHTWYEVNTKDPNPYRTDTWAVLERSAVTIMLVVASVWDLRDRGRVATELDLEHPETAPNQLV